MTIKSVIPDTLALKQKRLTTSTLMCEMRDVLDAARKEIFPASDPVALIIAKPERSIRNES